MVPHQGSTPLGGSVDNLLYFLIEFQFMNPSEK